MRTKLFNQISNLIKKNEIYKELLTKSDKEMTEMHRYFQSKQSHHQMMLNYFPDSKMDAQELVKKTANRVGLSVPESVNPR